MGTQTLKMYYSGMLLEFQVNIEDNNYTGLIFAPYKHMYVFPCTRAGRHSIHIWHIYGNLASIAEDIRSH